MYKQLNKVILSIVFVLLMPYAMAAEQTTVKCYVEMFGGGQQIYSIRFPTGNPSLRDVKNSLLGMEVYFGSNKNKLKIYDVMECVKGEQLFKSGMAQKLDKDRD